MRAVTSAIDMCAVTSAIDMWVASRMVRRGQSLAGCFSVFRIQATHNICWRTAANKVTIAAAGAIPVILKAMAAYAGHACVNEYGCYALTNIAWSDPAIQQTVKVLSSSSRYISPIYFPYPATDILPP